MKRLLPIALSSILSSLLFSQAEQVKLLGTWQDTTIIGSTNHTNVYNEIWGYANNGHEYAIIGTTAGTHFIDVTDPNNPTEAHFVAGKTQGGQIIHRDYHDYKGYLYAAAGEGTGSTLQIIDMQNLPESIEVAYDANDIFRTAHNIFIDTANAKLYALSARGNDIGYAPMRIFDISNPIQPVVLGDYSNFGGIQPSHVHDAFVKDNIAFLNLGNDGMAIVDFTDTQLPVTISTLTDYPSRGYNHSGWLSEDFGTYYLADENHGLEMKVLNVSDLCEIDVEGTFNAKVESTTSIPHNQIVACNYLYVSYYYDGLRVYDISDPLQPQLVRFFDTYSSPDGTQFRGAWGIYPFLPSGNILLSDMQNGLFVFESMGDNCSGQTRNEKLLEAPVCSLTPTKDFSFFNKINISPNPVTNQVSILLNLIETLPELEISLVGLDGKTVQNWQVENLTTGENAFSLLLDNSLSGGLYFLSMRSKQFSVTSRLVIGDW